MSFYECKEVLKNREDAEWEFVISFDTINKKVEEEILELQKNPNYKIPGFRVGKIPLSVIKKDKGKAVVANIISDFTQKALLDFTKTNPSYKLIGKNEEKVKIKSNYIMDDSNKNDFIFTTVFKIFPDFPELDWKALSLTKYNVQITDEDVDFKLKDIIKNNFDYVDAPDGYQVKTGDIASIDFDGTVSGKAFNGGSSKGFSIQVGSKKVLTDIEDALINKKVGEKFETKAEFPPNYIDKSLSGKTAIFNIKINTIQKKEEKPDLQDLINKFNCKNETEFRSKIREFLEKEYSIESETLLNTTLVDSINEKCNFEAPEFLIEQEKQQVKRDFPSISEEEVSTIAMKKVKLALMFGKFAQNHNISVTNQDITNKITSLAMQYAGKNNEQVKYVIDTFLKNNQLLLQINTEILEKKILAAILEKITINNEDVAIQKFKTLKKNTKAQNNLNKEESNV